MRSGGFIPDRRVPTIALGRLQRYVLGEFLRALGISVCVFTGLFVILASLRMEVEAEHYGTDVGTLLAALPYFLPDMLCYSVTIAFLVAAVLTFGRLKGSGEITGLQAAGCRLTTVLAPVLGVAFLAAVPMLFFVEVGIPWGYAGARDHVLRSGRSAILQRAASGMTLRVDSPGRSFRIHRFGEGPDGRKPLAIVEFVGGAPREVVLARDHELDAESAAGPDGGRDVLRFRLGGRGAEAPSRLSGGEGFAWARITRPGEVALAASGEIAIAVEGIASRRGKFGTREFALALSRNVRDARDLRERLASPDPGRLEAGAKKLRLLEMEIHRKLSILFGPLALTLLGIPLGLRLARGGRLAAFIAGIAVTALFYYPLWLSGQSLAVAGTLPAGLAVWMSNIVAGTVGAVWLSRMT